VREPRQVVIRKALRDPEFIRLANEPDTDKSSRVEGEDTPESAHMRCVAEEAIDAVLNRIKNQIYQRQCREDGCRHGGS
jgi:hypothetical protein